MTTASMVDYIQQRPLANALSNQRRQQRTEYLNMIWEKALSNRRQPRSKAPSTGIGNKGASFPVSWRFLIYYYYYLIFFKNNGSPLAKTLFSKGPLHNTYKKTTKFTIATFTNYTTHKLRIKPRSVPKQGFKCI